jgi:hypothetical protein
VYIPMSKRFRFIHITGAAEIKCHGLHLLNLEPSELLDDEDTDWICVQKERSCKFDFVEYVQKLYKRYTWEMPDDLYFPERVAQRLNPAEIMIMVICGIESYPSRHSEASRRAIQYVVEKGFPQNHIGVISNGTVSFSSSDSVQHLGQTE